MLLRQVKDEEHGEQRDRFFDFASLSARRRDVHVILVADYHESLAIIVSSSPLVERGRHLLFNLAVPSPYSDFGTLRAASPTSAFAFIFCASGQPLRANAESDSQRLVRRQH